MKKIIVVSLFVVMALSGKPANTQAHVLKEAGSQLVNQLSGNEITVLRADVISWVIRTYYGRPQKRRWNHTQNRWEDPYWIDM